jgi:C1A family cysteine protease
MTRSYGWKPEKPDIRDKPYEQIKPKMRSTSLPSVVDLKEFMPPIWDQGDIGSCVAQSIASALMYERIKTKQFPEFVPSRLFIYYNTRAAEGTLNEDAGAEIRYGIGTVTKLGFCDESLWPYVENNFKKRPPAKAYRNAEQYKAVEYFRLQNQNLNELRTCLASGYPFVFGFTVYLKSIEQADKDGFVRMPAMTDKVDGGHAVVCCGYDDSKKLFLIHNSWGTDVGQKGYYYMPYDYVTNLNLSDDFWTIRKIEDNDDA